MNRTRDTTLARRPDDQKRAAAGGTQRRALGDITNAARGAAAGKLDDAKAKAAVASRPVTRSTASKVAAIDISDMDVSFSESPMKPAQTSALPTDKSNDCFIMEVDAVSPVKPKKALAFEDIDGERAEEPEECTEYVQSLFSFLRELERDKHFMPDPKYLTTRQKHINASMRAILIDWLVEIHWRMPRRMAKIYGIPPFSFQPDTLFLTVSLLDRYLSLKEIPRSKLQLAGMAALMIACKYHEEIPPEMPELVEISAECYKAEDIIKMELSMLTALRYRVTICAPSAFLTRFLRAAHADKPVECVAWFLCERSLLEHDMLHFLPSVVAASAVYLARLNNGRTPWSPTLEHYTEYSEEMLLPCLRCISGWLDRRPDHEVSVVWAKSKTSDRCRVSEAVLRGV